VKCDLSRLASFLDIIEYLPKEKALRVYARDQGFNELDVAFLKRLGVEVVYEREGSTAGGTTETTFIFNAGVIKEEVQEGSGPALYIGPQPLSRVDVGYNCIALPSFEACPGAFRDFAVQWRSYPFFRESLGLAGEESRGKLSRTVCKVGGMLGLTVHLY